MKRIAEIKQRREHAFWKHRYILFGFTSICDDHTHCNVEWQQAEKNCLPIERRSKRKQLQSNLCNQSQWNRQKRRGSEKRSKYLPKFEVHWYLERDAQWVWTWTKSLFSSRHTYCSCCARSRQLLSILIIISPYVCYIKVYGSRCNVISCHTRIMA